MVNKKISAAANLQVMREGGSFVGAGTRAAPCAPSPSVQEKQAAPTSSRHLPQPATHPPTPADVCTSVSLPFRDVPQDATPVMGIRASASGRYLLVIFRGIPSEIWLMGGGAGGGAGGRPRRLRQVDLQFTAVEWLVHSTLPSPAQQQQQSQPGGLPVVAAPGSTHQGWDASQQHYSPVPAPLPPSGPGPAPEQPGSAGLDDAPEERLAFALVDGRVGVLGVRGRCGGRLTGAGAAAWSTATAAAAAAAAAAATAAAAAAGAAVAAAAAAGCIAAPSPSRRLCKPLAEPGRRRIHDMRPRRPTWAPLASGDFRVTALSSWAQFVLLGDAGVQPSELPWRVGGLQPWW